MSQPNPISGQRIRFGIFELDLQAGELCRNGAKVKLQEQPLQILQVLLQTPGRVVSREDLRKRIWPADTFVDFDRGLYSALARLRDALGDSAESPRFVETVPSWLSFHRSYGRDRFHSLGGGSSCPHSPTVTSLHNPCFDNLGAGDLCAPGVPA
jgi:hypothetical protein